VIPLLIQIFSRASSKFSRLLLLDAIITCYDFLLEVLRTGTIHHHDTSPHTRITTRLAYVTRQKKTDESVFLGEVNSRICTVGRVVHR
jgi:hypothetical protein